MALDAAVVAAHRAWLCRLVGYIRWCDLLLLILLEGKDELLRRVR